MIGLYFMRTCLAFVSASRRTRYVHVMTQTPAGNIRQNWTLCSLGIFIRTSLLSWVQRHHLVNMAEEAPTARAAAMQPAIDHANCLCSTGSVVNKKRLSMDCTFESSSEPLCAGVCLQGANWKEPQTGVTKADQGTVLIFRMSAESHNPRDSRSWWRRLISLNFF